MLKWMPDSTAKGASSYWKLPTQDEELQWWCTLVERATRTEDGMYKCTSSAEVVYIFRRVEEAKAAYLVEMAKAAKVGKSKGKSGDGGCSKAEARHKQ